MSKTHRLEIIESTFIVLSALGTLVATVTKEVLFRRYTSNYNYGFEFPQSQADE